MEAFIPRRNIIQDLGGDDTWEYTYVEPAPGENDAIANGGAVRAGLQAAREEQVREFEALTRRWISGEETGGDRGRVAEKLRVGYWELDRYVRARTLYDRTGVIGEGGRLEFYGYRKPMEEAGARAILNTSADDID